MTSDDYEGHLGEGVIAAYVDRRLGAEERRAVEAHLAECDACRAEVVDVARVVSGGRRPWILPTAGLGVAAAALLIIALTPRATVIPDGPVLRGGSEDAVAITPIAPSDSAPTPRDSVRLAWHAVVAGASYRVTVTDARGDVVWTGNTPDTAIVPAAAFAGGTTYFWSVDVLLPDGRAATTGIQTLRTGP